MWVLEINKIKHGSLVYNSYMCANAATFCKNNYNKWTSHVGSLILQYLFLYNTTKFYTVKGLTLVQYQQKSKRVWISLESFTS